MAAAKRPWQQASHSPCGGAVHRIDDHVQAHRFQPATQGLGIEFRLQAGQVGAHRIKALGGASHRHGDASSGEPGFHSLGEVTFHRAPKRTFDFQSQPFRRVVTGRDHQGSEGLALHHGPAAGWRGHGGFAEQGNEFTTAYRGTDGFSQLRSQEAAVVANHHLAAGHALGARVGQLLGRRRRNGQEALQCDVDAKHPPPAIGAEGNRAGLQG